MQIENVDILDPGIRVKCIGENITINSGTQQLARPSAKYLFSLPITTKYEVFGFMT
jgi:hypothetical protein